MPRTGTPRLRLGVAARLTAGLVGLTVLTILAASVALYGTQAFRDGFDRIALSRFGQLVAMAHLTQQSHSVTSAGPRMVGATDRRDLEQQVANTRDLFRRFDAAAGNLVASGADPTVVAGLTAMRTHLQDSLNRLAALVADRQDADAALARAMDDLDRQAQDSRRVQSRLAEVITALTEINASQGDIVAIEAQVRNGDVIRRITDDMARAVNVMLRVPSVRYPGQLAPMLDEVRRLIARVRRDSQELPGAFADGYVALGNQLNAQAEGPASVFALRLRQIEVTEQVMAVLNASKEDLDRFIASVTRQYEALEADIAEERGDFTAFIANIFNGLFAIAAAAVTGAAVIFLFLRRRVIGRLTGLQHCMVANAEGQAVPIPADGHDEIADMGRAFGYFVGEVGRRETALRAAKDEAERAYAQLASANASIREGMRYAQRIQQSLLPDVDAHGGLLEDLAVAWQPLDAVGGDYYWIGAQDGRCIIAVMDCTGHGVPGAFMTAIVASALARILQDHAQDHAHDDPAGILATLNTLVRGALRQDRPEATSNDGLDAAIVVLDPAARRLSFAGANMPLLHDDGQALHLIKGDRHSLGYRESRPDFEFQRHDLDLTQGMRFYLMTDGVTDQIGGPTRRLFGRRRVQELLRAGAHLPMQAQVRQLLDALAEYRGEEPRRDDQTFIGFVPCLVPADGSAEARPADAVPA
ncbi:SpoIIE family protein phosphatase [Azospirillum sp. TSO22-1]|uniref:SpoIIE family protein phosphatase n=1 Tax=Azospirillum sp. TSO22-1 TaxID=716789 RepID=UPI000D65C66F|nr:SpoIIE family protein phosphatase [Azospirillum sp. TSO22-1]